MIADCAYTAWGNCNSASYLPTPFGWKARAYRDSETNLVLMGARCFSPALGRFLSRDPIAFAGGVNVYGFCNGDPINYADPTGLCGESLGDVFAQLLSGDTWREGLATSGYALCNLLTGGRAFRDQTDRPGFRESQGSWAVGGIAAAGAACLVAAPVVATNPMYISWMAGTTGATGAAASGGGERFMRLVGAAEAQASEEQGGFISTGGRIWGFTRIFPAENLETMKQTAPFDDLEKYSHIIEVELRSGWRLPVEAGGALIGTEGQGSNVIAPTVGVPEINNFLLSLKTYAR